MFPTILRGLLALLGFDSLELELLELGLLKLSVVVSPWLTLLQLVIVWLDILNTCDE